MRPHEQRVVTEKKELDIKREKLAAFLTGEVFPALPIEERDRLDRQLRAMGVYSNILGERIHAFPP